jgi:hypothetical protein
MIKRLVGMQRHEIKRMFAEKLPQAMEEFLSQELQKVR